MEHDTLHPFTTGELHEETRHQIRKEINEQTGDNHVAQGGIFSGTDVQLIHERAVARAVVALTAGCVRATDCEQLVQRVSQAALPSKDEPPAAGSAPAFTFDSDKSKKQAKKQAAKKSAKRVRR